MKQRELLESAIRLASDNPSQEKLLRQFLLANTAAESMKFDMYKYVAKDSIRLVMSCVYFHDGFKVASDAHILICIKEDYPADLEGKMVNKRGEMITEVGQKYPNYTAVKPSGGHLRIKLNFDEVAALSKYASTEKKVSGRPTYVRIGDNFFVFSLFFKLVTFARHIGAYHLLLYSQHGNLVVENGESWGILMPLKSAGDDCPIVELS